MVNEKLREIGEKLDVSKEDIKKVNIYRFIEKLMFLLLVLIYPLIAVIFYNFGVDIGVSSKDSSNYPYSFLAFTINKKSHKKIKQWLLLYFIGIVIFIISFALGYYYGKYHIVLGYSVYSKNKNSNNPFHEISTRLCNLGNNPGMQS